MYKASLIVPLPEAIDKGEAYWVFVIFFHSAHLYWIYNSSGNSNWFASLGAQTVKNLPAMQEMWVQSLGRKDPLEKGMAMHSSILAWRIPWAEEPGRLQCMGSQRAGHDWVTNIHSRNLHILRLRVPNTCRRQWQATPGLLPGKSHWPRSLVGCSPWGLKESDTTEWLNFPFSLSCIGEGHGNPLQCSCLENPRDGGAWWAAVYGVAQSRTRLKRLSSSSSAKHYSKCLYIFSFNIQNSMRKVGGFFFTSREFDMEKFTQIVYKNLNSGLSVSKGYHLVHWTWYLVADSRKCIICWVCKDKSEVVLAVHEKVMIIFQLGPNFWIM